MRLTLDLNRIEGTTRSLVAALVIDSIVQQNKASLMPFGVNYQPLLKNISRISVLYVDCHPPILTYALDNQGPRITDLTDQIYDARTQVDAFIQDVWTAADVKSSKSSLLNLFNFQKPPIQLTNEFKYLKPESNALN